MIRSFHFLKRGKFVNLSGFYERHLRNEGSLVEHVIQKERICSNICTCHFIAAHYFVTATSSLCINGTKLGRAKKIHFLTKFRDKKVIKIPSLSLWPCSCQLGRDQSVSKWMITTVKSGIKIYRRG